MDNGFDPPPEEPGLPAAAARDSAQPETGEPGSGRADEALFPWDCDPPPADPDGPRERHDAFTEARKSVYLRALIKAGCILDACRLTGISPRTVYRHQESDLAFAEHCRIALRVSGTPAELTAWSRAVEGVEQPFACGGEVHVRRRYSDGLLRLILQGSNPKKYGPNPGFKRKRLLKYERKQIERELRAEFDEERLRHLRAPHGAHDSILRKLSAIARHREPKMLAAGWTKTEDGHWVPPGYGPIPDWQPPAGSQGDDSAGDDLAPGEDTPRDSV